MIRRGTVIFVTHPCCPLRFLNVAASFLPAGARSRAPAVKLGSIEEGKLGDVVVLSGDYFDPSRVPDGSLRKLHC